MRMPDAVQTPEKKQAITVFAARNRRRLYASTLSRISDLTVSVFRELTRRKSMASSMYAKTGSTVAMRRLYRSFAPGLAMRSFM